MRLIEVNVLKEWIENWFTKNRLYHPYAKNNNIPITELYDILEQMPSVQPDVPDTNVGDMINRQDAIDALCKRCDLVSDDEPCTEECNDIKILKLLPSAQQWIPIKMRPMDAEEREYWEDHFGYELADEDAVLFDCQMPDDGQEILVSYRKWIGMDKCEIDCGCYGLEGNGDWDGVVAWMPLPEPWKGEER